VDLGLPAVAFTEHADFTPWTLKPGQYPETWTPLIRDSVLTPPLPDLAGYTDCLQNCRDRYPELQILSGVELSEPHWHAARAEQLLSIGRFDRVLAAVHSAATSDGNAFTGVHARYADQRPDQVVRDYLEETVHLIERFPSFEILAHIDFPVRYWPVDAKPYDPKDFEGEYRQVLRCLAMADKVLEVNTKVPLHPVVLTWWRQEGGQRITFASDAHAPDAIASGFRDAVDLAETTGFHPGPDPHDFWRRG
jgi:histidinol-phosphatase (PHP family)